MVGVTGFEPAASCSQSRRATNCATPRFFYFAFFLIFSVLPCFVRPLAKLSPMALLCNAMRSVLLRFLRLPASATGSGRLRHPKQARYQLRYTRLLSFLSGWSYSPKPPARQRETRLPRREETASHDNSPNIIHHPSAARKYFLIDVCARLCYSDTIQKVRRMTP